MIRTLRSLILSSIFLAAITTQAQQTFIKNVNIVDVDQLRLIEQQTVVIEKEKIVSISPQVPAVVPTDAMVIDGEGKFLAPGLVDAHIHLFQSGGLYTRPDVLDLRSIRPYETERAWLKEHSKDFLRRYLSCGITTTIDVGGPQYNYHIRDQLQEDRQTASVYLTGPLISTYQPEAFKLEDAPIIKVKDPEEAVQMVKNQLPYQPDFIKIWYIVFPGGNPQDNYPIVKAAIDESHRHGLRVMVHATQLRTARLAVEAGADVLVHSVDDHEVDEAFVDLLRAQKTVYCPTLIVHQKYSDVFAQNPQHTAEDFAIANPFALGSLYDGQHFMGKEKELIEQYQQYATRGSSRDSIRMAVMQKNLNKLWKGGVTIATGTDAGNIGTHHASSYYEEIATMKAAGMTDGAILKASTVNGAHFLGKSQQFGQVKVGQLANLILLEQNPLKNIEHLKNPQYVVHRGTVMQADTLLPNSPEILAQQQLNAYNARNIDAFLAPYSDSIAIYSFPEQLQSQGKTAMRPGYANMFSNLSLLHCQLLNRVVEGNTVIDHERVRLNENRYIKAIAIYKIKKGKIAEVYFIQ